MKDFDALKDLWSAQRAEPLISFEELRRNIKQQRSSFGKRLLSEIITMTLVATMLLLLWIYIPVNLWSSHISISILLGCCLYYIYNQVLDYYDIRHHNELKQNAAAYLSHLKIYQRKRHTFNTRRYQTYSIFIGLAFILYLPEVAIIAPLWQTLSAMAFTIIWFVISWRLMRSYKRREQERLNAIIDNVERILAQFESSK